MKLTQIYLILKSSCRTTNLLYNFIFYSYVSFLIYVQRLKIDNNWSYFNYIWRLVVCVWSSACRSSSKRDNFLTPQASYILIPMSNWIRKCIYQLLVGVQTYWYQTRKCSGIDRFTCETMRTYSDWTDAEGTSLRQNQGDL